MATMHPTIAPFLLILILFSANVESQLILNKGLGGFLGIRNCVSKSYSGSSIGIPASFDSRDKWPGCVSPVRDQGQCGSCWAFSSTSVLADRFCVASNATIKRLLSPQYMLDCNTDCQYPLLGTNCQQGCQGGYMDNAWNYFRDDGVVKDSCLTYQAQKGSSCPSSCNGYSGSVSSETKFETTGTCQKFGTVRDAQIDILLYGPIQGAFTVYEDFYEYKSGVYVHSSGAEKGGHAIRIVGWGTENGVDYWTVANSWGTGWGSK
eukprot:TRINITY_DN10738_c0_g1_i3.p1 TRINITY_DN10738_c0_g1~~TRINITY_DN10738_c0_g1_i3.p1  ORF type:complete len:263 (+),score=49.63 TRINITY_DN10738_c0_g1_i3:35-823(+)